MGLIVNLLTLPLAPVRGAAWIAEQVKEEAERQWSSPAAVQAELHEVEALRASGDLSDEEADARQEELMERLLAHADGGLTLGADEWSDDG